MGGSRVHITVGADIDADFATRSVAEQDGDTWKLKFTEGDKIHFSEDLKKHPIIKGTFRMVASLSLVPGSISPDGKSATFEGDATFFKQGANWWDWNESTEYTLQNRDNPMDDLKTTPKGHLIHSGGTAGSGFYHLQDDKTINYEYNSCLAPDVATLMASGIEVSGNYDSGTKRFALEKSSYPIFNCTISGLTPDTEYYVGLRQAASLIEYNDEWKHSDCNYDSAVTTDGSGKATFAITFGWGGDRYWAIWFSEDRALMMSEVDKSVYLGQRDFEAGVYDITMEAEDGAPTKSEQ